MRRIDNTLLAPSNEVMARDTLKTGIDVQPALGRLTDGELAEGIADGDRLPVAPITDEAVLAAPTGGNHRQIVGATFTGRSGSCAKRTRGTSWVVPCIRTLATSAS
jgi:hypothetical protein